MENVVVETLENGTDIHYKKEPTIDFYGDNNSYIHLKFGHIRKMFYFTPEFEKANKRFANGFKKFFWGEEQKLFKEDIDVVRYIKKYNIDIPLYQNYHDLEFVNVDEAIKYLENYKGD